MGTPRSCEVARDGMTRREVTQARRLLVQRSTACQQRVRKRQPLGGSIGLGTSPVEDDPLPGALHGGSGSGTAESSACVYGMAGCA